MSDALFTPDCKLTPYWWELRGAPCLAANAAGAGDDVVVIGSGLHGLSTAPQTARGGRDTLVLDAEDAGWGCSTRNGGRSRPYHIRLRRARKRHGPDTAFRLIREGHNSLAWVERVLSPTRRSIAISVSSGVSTRRITRRSTRPWRDARRDSAQGAGGRNADRAARRAAARAGDRRVFRRRGLHPPRLDRSGAVSPGHAGPRDAGRRHDRSALRRHQPSTRTATGFASRRRAALSRRATWWWPPTAIQGKLTPWLQRRVIPIGSYIIATETIAPDMMARLMPKDRIVSDTRKVVYYYRASPDGTRILFGGRVSHNETDPRLSGPLLHDAMTGIFPELKTTRISHSWCGFIAYTFDELMHAGHRDGLYYAMGYCGSGVGMAGYLGMRIGQQVLGRPEGATAFDGLISRPGRSIAAIRGSSRRRSCITAGAIAAAVEFLRQGAVRRRRCVAAPARRAAWRALGRCLIA